MGKIRAAITGVGAYLPDYILTNDELSRMVDTSDEWIMTRIGIKTRHILKGEALGTSYMGVKAVRDLLEKKNMNPEEIDLVICKKVIVVGADKMSSIVDYTDRKTCPIFGDGAAAVLLEPDEEGYGVIDHILHSDGTGAPHLYMKAGGSRYPASEETIRNNWHTITQDGQAVFKAAVSNMADVSVEMMERYNLTSDDIRYLVPHQANLRIIDATANRMGLTRNKCMINIDRYGNTTAATIPLCLYDYEKELKRGDKLILASFGGGYTWGSVYVKWAYDGESAK